jgi:molybdopterin-containing oxidoreductase family iron-sulfur binding subunit
MRPTDGQSTTDQNLESPYAPVPTSDDPSRGKEVFAPTEGPFEAPAKEFVPGPYYKAVEEKFDGVDERPIGEDELKPSVDRRDFMKLFSMGGLATSVACVRRPVEKAVPYVNQPMDEPPGTPVYYASTCGDCTAGCGVMVKTREGRPAKIEGLPGHPISGGKLCSMGQASLQGLYHPERRQSPAYKFGSTLDSIGWDDAFTLLAKKLKDKKVGILTGGSTGNRLGFYRDFLEKIGSDGQNVFTFEPNTLMESITAAHKIAFGVEAMPRVDLQQASHVVGIGSDFLEIGTSPIYHARGYAAGHDYQNGTMGHFTAFESTMTNTGGSADHRHVIPAGTETIVGLLLVRSLLENSASKGSGSTRARIKTLLTSQEALVNSGYGRVGVPRETFDKLAADLLATKSVVLAGGSQNFDENATTLQLVAIMANELVGAYEQVLMLAKGSMVPPVEVGSLQRFFASAGDLDALIVIDSNPEFTLPPSWKFSDAIKGIETVVSIQNFPNETDELAHMVLPANHYLESWGDEQPVAGFWSARQPAVRPVTDSRQAEDILLWVAASMGTPLPYSDYRAYIQDKWKALHAAVGGGDSFRVFWEKALHKGFSGLVKSLSVGALNNLTTDFAFKDPGQGGLKLIAPLDVRLYDGRGANKPVLQEVGDSLTTIAWDSFVLLHPETCKKLGFRRNDLVVVEAGGGKFEAAIYPMPGMHLDSVAIPRGNGHTSGGTIEGGNGVNPLIALAKAQDPLTGAPVTAGQSVKLTATGKVYRLAAMQKHNDIANRSDIVKTMSLANAKRNLNKTVDLDTVPDLYPELPGEEYRWGLSVDLSRCNGCSACMVACSLENNVPQVGREQVLMGREMHWIRMDRYFSGPVNNPEVTYQAVMCQHCNHAPCEAVCPVFATNHDPEGINTMTYNRCVGTRYCANACPYKVRRFNWWTHRWGVMGKRPQDRQIRALNPDVTVRTRGIMEKCNFCYHRVRDAKHAAKLRGAPLRDGEFRVACQQTCPSDAITFGNLNDPRSAITRNRKDARAYLMLGQDPSVGHYGIKTLPNVSYLAKVTHKEENSGHAH